jgi:hypothetical protein
MLGETAQKRLFGEERVCSFRRQEILSKILQKLLSIEILQFTVGLHFSKPEFNFHARCSHFPNDPNGFDSALLLSTP